MPPQHSQYPSSYPRPSSSDSHSSGQHNEDTKSPYDDLIDQYAVPFHHNSPQKPITVNPSAFRTAASTHGAPTYPLHQKESHVSDMKTKDLEPGDPAATDWGYPPTPVKEDKESLHWSTLIVPDSLACRLYLLTVLIETTIDLAIEGDLLVRFRDTGEADNGIANGVAGRKMPVYLAIFAIAHVFQFIMALDAVYARNTLQFVFLGIFNALFLLYAIIQIREIRELQGLLDSQATAKGISKIPVNVLTTIIPIVISVAQLMYMGLGWKIYTEFGWKVYKFLGADRRIKSMYAHYQIFLCLVKFDIFFWIGFSVQFIWLVLNPYGAEYYLTCAALPLSILVLIEGHLAARYENKWMMLTFLAGCGAAMVYFVYKLVKVVRFRDTDTFLLVWQTLTTFSVLAILLLLGTFIFACFVMKDFGRGLKTQMSKNKGGLQRGKSQYAHRGPMSTHPNRMSIE